MELAADVINREMLIRLRARPSIIGYSGDDKGQPGTCALSRWLVNYLQTLLV